MVSISDEKYGVSNEQIKTGNPVSVNRDVHDIFPVSRHISRLVVMYTADQLPLLRIYYGNLQSEFR